MGLPRRAVRAGQILLLAQLLGAICFSLIQYRSYSLTSDYGGYAQAFHQIADGHLNPYLTVFRSDFLHNNLDLAMYPLAWLGRIVPTPFLLPLSQDVAVVATEAIALAWIGDYLRTRTTGPMPRLEPTRGTRLYLAAAVLLVADPWSWETFALPIHFEAVACLFAVLLARDLWRGSRRLILVWIPLAIGSEALGGLYVLVVGLAALMTGATALGRKTSAAVAASGACALFLASRLHLIGRGGNTLTAVYGYLVGGRAHPTVMDLAGGVVAHPASAATTLGGHLGYVLGYIAGGGILGLATPVGLVAVVLIILPNALASPDIFIAFPSAYQSWPTQPFLIFGTIVVLAQVAAGPRGPTSPVLQPLAVVALVPALVVSFLELSQLSRQWLVPRDEALDLRAIAAIVPDKDEVIADQYIIGRLAERHLTAFAYVSVGDRVPIQAPRLAVILPKPAGSLATLAYGTWLESLPRAGVAFRGLSLELVEWTEPTCCAGSVTAGPSKSDYAAAKSPDGQPTN